MLSNKLTFSLASLVVLLVAALCLPVAAQLVEPLVVEMAQPDAAVPGVIPAGDFAVYGKNATAANAMISPPYYTYEDDLPDLEEFFGFGGVIEIVVARDSAIEKGDLAISEIMWGLDDDGIQAAAAKVDKQWIEIYNASTEDTYEIQDTDLILLFTPFGYITSHTTPFIAYDFLDANDGKVRKEKDDPLTTTYRVIDRVSNITIDDNLEFRSRWTMPGSSGNTYAPAAGNNYAARSPLISANRTINYDTSAVPAGHEADKWEATDAFARRNTVSSLIVANPGVGLNPVTFVLGGATAAPPADMIVINEVRNNTDSDLEWIEIKNVTAPGTDPIQIENWQVSLYTGGASDVMIGGVEQKGVGVPKGETVMADLPRYRLGPQEILLIVNRDPSETELAGGVDLDILIDTNKEQLQKGATHQYIIRDTLVLPDDGNFLLLLRTATDKNNTDELIHDAVGSLEMTGYLHDRTIRTEVLPFKNYATMGDDKVGSGKDKRGAGERVVIFGSEDGNHTAWSRIPKGVTAGNYIVENTNGRHKGAWHLVSGTGAFDAAWATAGVGYDREVDLDFSPGTPGYENMIANTVDDYVSTQPDPDGMEYTGMISISEIMFDAGPRWNLVQWIELYNNSMTQTVDLTGWEMEIRNAKEDVESYVDSVFTFEEEGRAVLLPNQTLLIVSGGGTNDVPNERVYNLYEHHRRALGLTTRRSVLLSPTGFYIRLTDRKNLDRDSREDQDVTVDEAGNVMVDGAARHIQWALPDVEANDVRKSIVRQYGQRYTPQGGNDPDNIRYQPAGGEAPNKGNPLTAEVEASPNGANDFWRESDIVGAGISFYGHRDDISTPGYRTGGPLPVSLSSFRPERDKTTGEVVIRWITQSELNNAGFNILRSETKDGEFKVVNLTGIIAGHGTTSEKHVYTYTDKTAKPNVAYYYQIEDVSLNGHLTTLQTTHMRGNVNASGKLTTTWSDLKLQK